MRRTGPAASAVPLVLALLLVSSCRTSAPAGEESPFVPGTPLAAVHSLRILARVRATTGEQTQSFKAQIFVEPSAERMQLIAYTPVGTTAMTLDATGDQITFLDYVNRTAWQGSAAQLAETIPFFGGGKPYAWALAAAGYPGDLDRITVAYDPAPPARPTRVTFTGSGATADLTILAMVATTSSLPPAVVPRGFVCCVQPRL